MESEKKEQQSIGERVAYRFSIQEKKEAVRAIENGELVKVVIARYQISDKTLAKWRNRYSQTHKPVAPRVYMLSEKRSVLRAIEKGMSVSDVAIAFGIQNSGTIREWIKQTKAENTELCAITMKKARPQEVKDRDLEALRQQLAEAQLKIKALETLIDVAEDHLKIDIRKKPGARQSPK